LFLGWGFPIEHLLLRNLQQIAAILRQQIESVGDVGMSSTSACLKLRQRVRSRSLEARKR